ncbi:MAG: PP2C family protein-serine/threonine phosphatase [Phycisphaerales bacterium]
MPHGPARVAVVACGLSAASAADWWETVHAAWPARSKPLARIVELGIRESNELASVLDGTRVAVLLAGGEACAKTLRRLIAELDDRSMPALLVAKDEQALATADASSSTAVVPITSAAGREAIAGAVYALLCREPALDQVKRQLELERAVKAAAARELERHEAETAVAVMVQRAFIPNRMPAIDGLEAGVLYRPGSSLSGDMFDLVQLDDDHAGFFVADAMGHGVAAALLTMLVSRLLPMKDTGPSGERLVPPGEAMTRFNRAFLQRRADDSTMVTAVYGVIDLRTGRTTLASAGHPLPVVVGPRGETREIDVGGPSAGLDEHAAYEEASFTLQDGETLLLYTDGFEWAFSPEAKGGRRPNNDYLAAFAGLGHRDENTDLTHALAALTARMDSQRGSLHQPDDITLLGIARRPRASELRSPASTPVRLAA